MTIINYYLDFLAYLNDGKEVRGWELFFVNTLLLGALLWFVALNSLLVTILLMLIIGPSSIPETDNVVDHMFKTTWNHSAISLWFSITKTTGIWGTVLFVGSIFPLNYIESRRDDQQ